MFRAPDPIIARLLLIATLGLAACAPVAAEAPQAMEVTAYRIDLFDAARDRAVPVVVYRPDTPPPYRLAILSHGYGGAPEDYGFVARRLVQRGRLVAAIDHEIEGDAPIPTTGEPRIVRMPNWRIGADSIGFVADDMVAQGLARSGPVLLVGHSNGGDMDMLFAAEHPDRVAAVVSLDNRRMAFPRAGRVPILSLRSSDQVADPGVIPDETERAGLRITIIPVAVRHDDMWDGATEAQQAEMLRAVENYLDANGA